MDFSNVMLFGFIVFLAYQINKTNKLQRSQEALFEHTKTLYAQKDDGEIYRHTPTVSQAPDTFTAPISGLHHHIGSFDHPKVIIRNHPQPPEHAPPLEPLTTPVGNLYAPDKKETFDSLVITDKTSEDLKRGIAKVTLENYILDDMGWSSIDNTRRSILNFYGPPGVGKTKAAMVLANELNLPLLHVDYSSIVSKWVGSTGRNLKKIFQTANQYGAIIFLDEADSLLNQRSENVESSNSEYLNQEKNILMQELDRYNGIVILTTNLFSNYDEALLRRISQHVEFQLPNEGLLQKLLSRHIPVKTKLDQSVNLQAVAKASAGLSGGDVKNLVREAIVQCVVDFKAGKTKSPKLTQQHLLNQVVEIRRGKDKHKGVRNKLGI
jgi:adenylate kinase family enzyme